MSYYRWFLALSIGLLGVIALLASAQEELSPEELVARQKQQILDTSGILPGELWAADGEAFFYEAHGEQGLTMEACDFGLGEGVIEGAYAQMPRYFADTDKVQDIDSRVHSCLTDVVGVDSAEIKRGDVVNVSAFIAMMSTGFEQDVLLDDPQEQAMYDLGEAIWYYRAGGLDMSCAVCHEVNANKRIRLQTLGDVKGDAMATHWPAYRFSKDVVWTMEDRLRGCWGNVSVPKPKHYSDVLVAVQLYMSHQANGVEIDAPGFVR